MTRELVCIACPMGCHLTVTEDSSHPGQYHVSGNTCKNGELYGIKEVTAPVRTLTTTVIIKNAFLPRLPVVTDGQIPKGKMLEAMDVIAGVKVNAPVRKGDVIIKDLLGSGVDLIASRSMERKER